MYVNKYISENFQVRQKCLNVHLNYIASRSRSDFGSGKRNAHISSICCTYTSAISRIKGENMLVMTLFVCTRNAWLIDRKSNIVRQVQRHVSLLYSTNLARQFSGALKHCRLKTHHVHSYFMQISGWNCQKNWTITAHRSQVLDALTHATFLQQLLTETLLFFHYV